MRGRSLYEELAGFKSVAAGEAVSRQDAEEGFWFGEGPQAGVVPSSELRMIAVSTRNPDQIDLTPFGPVSPRSVYQKFTVPRDCEIGLIELELLHPGTQPYSPVLQWAQVSIYRGDGVGGIPLTLLARCPPIPLAVLYHGNTQVVLLPLWAPLTVSQGNVIWVGISPKAYSGPGEAPPSSYTTTTTYINARGNRDVAATDFLKSDQVEPPLTVYTTHNDRRILVRLYEAPATLKLANRSDTAAPLSPTGFRSVISRPVRGQLGSAYMAGVRPGHGTQPWDAVPGSYFYGVGSAYQQHNNLGNIQGGTAYQRWHWPLPIAGRIAYGAAGPTTGWTEHLTWDELANYLVFTASGGIRQNTVLGADNCVIYLAGGGAAGMTRGAYFAVAGNEYFANYNGVLMLVAGNPGTGGIWDGAVSIYATGAECLRLQGGQAKAGNGSAAAPFWTYLNDLDLGGYRIGADIGGFAAGGVEVMRYSAAGVDASGATAKLREAGADLIPAATASGCMCMLWSGLIANIPAGWQLCNGTNFTPDYRGLFIVGVDAAAGTYPPGAVGGSATVILDVTQMPAHAHSVNQTSTGAHGHIYDKFTAGAGSGWAGPGQGAHVGTATTGNPGNHNHSVGLNNTGGSAAHENRPQYKAACWIGRVR